LTRGGWTPSEFLEATKEEIFAFNIRYIRTQTKHG